MRAQGSPTPDRRRAIPRRRGLTLIEVMVVMTVVAILAAVAYPSYNAYVLRSHRVEAQAVLVQGVQFMERHFTLNNSYSVSSPNPFVGVSSALTARYTFTSTLAQDTFTLQAAPTTLQSGESCGTMTINQAGAKTPAGCW